jgi:hypothetical protein
MKKALVLSLSTVLLGIAGNAMAEDLCSFMERNASQFDRDTAIKVTNLKPGEALRTNINGQKIFLTRTADPAITVSNGQRAAYKLAASRGDMEPEAMLQFLVNIGTLTNDGYSCYLLPKWPVIIEHPLPVDPKIADRFPKARLPWGDK